MRAAATFSFALVACIVASPGISLANPIEPGSYNAQTTTSNITADTLPESVRKTMSEPMTRKRCISPAKAATWPLKAFLVHDCKMVTGDDTGRDFRIVVTCAMSAKETITIAADGSYTSTHFDMRTKTDSVGGAHPMSIERHTVADRVGACSTSDEDQD